MEVLQKAMSETFRSLTNVAMEGFDCRTADQKSLKCHYLLANYVSDLPEAWDMLGVKGQNSSFPCHRCTVPRELLSIPTKYQLRSVQDTKDCRSDGTKQRTKTKEMECLDKYSLSVHASFLETFPFIESSPYLDIYSILTYEPLHNVFLGISNLLKEMYCQRLYDDTLSSIVKDTTEKYKRVPEIRTALLNGMNQILACIERDSPATAFKIDFSDAGKSGNYNGFFMKDGLKGMLEAKDHRAVDQVMPFLAMFLDRFCGESVSTSIVTNYAQITTLMFKRNMDPGWNVREIRELQSRFIRFKEEVKYAYGKYQCSEMGTPKFHMLDHIGYDIERMGGLQYGDASYFERAHFSLKERFRESSRRKSSVMEEVVSNFESNMVRMEERDTSELVLAGKKGARYATFQDEVGSLVRGGLHFTIGELHYTYLSRRSERKRAIPAGNLKTAADHLVQDIGFPGTRIFIELLKEKYDCKDSFPQITLARVTLAFVTGGFMPTSKDVVRVEGEGYGIRYKEPLRKVSQRIVSSGNFYGTGPRKDCVLVESERNADCKGKKFRVTWVAKVLRMFHLDADGHSEAIAFVRYFDVVPPTDDVMSRLGCVNVKWSGEGTRPQWFDIIPVPSLTGVVPVLTIDHVTRLAAEKAEHKKYSILTDSSTNQVKLYIKIEIAPFSTSKLTLK